jgi:hypothetical protein
MMDERNNNKFQLRVFGAECVKASMVAIFLASTMLSGCDSRKTTDMKYLFNLGDYSKLEAAVDAFSSRAGECLLDVRDRGQKFESSPNCAALSVLSKSYLAAGGQKHDEPSPLNAKANYARSVAMSAKAVSCVGGGFQIFW